MPSKNTIKKFESDAMYHVYNRGNNKRQIFFDERDFAVFLSFLKYALLSDSSKKAKDTVDIELISKAQQFNLRRLGLSGQLELVAYCLMPNHFHLLFYQYEQEAITKIMRSIATGYVMYFNKRHNTTGSLFQGIYKASKIDNEPYWQHISRYIHLNPIDLGINYSDYDYSSFKYYTGKVEAEWLNFEKGLNGLDIREYIDFLDEWIPERNNIKYLEKYLADH